MSLFVLATLAAGCGSNGKARLSIYASYGQSEKTFHLRCAPAGGDVLDPIALCKAIATQSKLMLTPKITSVCSGNPIDSRSVGVRGTYGGKRVNVSTSDCALPEGLPAFRLWASGLPSPYGER